MITGGEGDGPTTAEQTILVVV